MFSNLIIILYLVLIEGLLSFDNALAIAALVKRRLKNSSQQRRAVIYGIGAAYIFRIGIIFVGLKVMEYEWIKILVGVYLIFLACNELFFKSKQVNLAEQFQALSTPSQEVPSAKRIIFIYTIIQIEILDLIFSIDSVSVALAVSNLKWVLITGSVLGILLMRFASNFFIRIMDLFPILEKTAFVLVGMAGLNIFLKIPENIFFCLIFIVLVCALVLNKSWIKWSR